MLETTASPAQEAPEGPGLHETERRVQVWGPRRVGDSVFSVLGVESSTDSRDRMAAQRCEVFSVAKSWLRKVAKW